MTLIPQNLRSDGWPKSCLQSWLASFTRWAKAKEPRTLTAQCVDALRHTMQCNLLYIEELEEKLGGEGPTNGVSGEANAPPKTAYQL